MQLAVRPVVANIKLDRYERYLNMDDDEAFAHLTSLGTGLPSYDDLAQRLIFDQVNGESYAE